MARYIGDLTAPDRHKERECAAQMLDNIARRIRDCQIRSVSVGSSRDVDSRDWPLGVPPILSAWDIDMTYQANPHVEQPCGDNPQPCGCNPYYCNDCQGTCHHMVEAYEKGREERGET